MRPYLLLFLLSCTCFSGLRAQTIEPGYLVLSSGDTLRGEVENAFWEDPPASVRFRSAPTAELRTYSALQLRGLGLTSGRRLRLELLPLDRSATTDVSRLPNNLRSYQKPEQVLADVLVDGPASLLGVTLGSVHHFFVRREAQPYFEMTERNYLKLQNGTQVIADANNYTGQLLLYFGDCKAATTAAAQVPFTADGLKTVVQAYNRECSATRQAGRETTDQKATTGRVAIRAGILAGARYNSVLFSGEAGPVADFAGLNADGRVHAQAGGYVDIVSGGRRLALHAALLASRFGRSTPVSFRPVNQSAAQSGRFTWQGTVVNLQIGLRGFAPLGTKLQLLYGGGYEINSFLKPKSELTYGGTTFDFLGGFRGTLLPYLEAGLTQGRFGGLLNGRLYESQFYAGQLVRSWSLSALLSYRLNKNVDTSPAKAGK